MDNKRLIDFIEFGGLVKDIPTARQYQFNGCLNWPAGDSVLCFT